MSRRMEAAECQCISRCLQNLTGQLHADGCLDRIDIARRIGEPGRCGLPCAVPQAQQSLTKVKGSILDLDLVLQQQAQSLLMRQTCRKCSRGQATRQSSKPVFSSRQASGPPHCQPGHPCAKTRHPAAAGRDQQPDICGRASPRLPHQQPAIEHMASRQRLRLARRSSLAGSSSALSALQRKPSCPSARMPSVVFSDAFWPGVHHELASLTNIFVTVLARGEPAVPAV